MYRITQKITACFLVTTLMWFYGAKAVHHHEHSCSGEHCSTEHSSSSSDESTDNCFICHFSLMPFLKSELAKVDTDFILLNEQQTYYTTEISFVSIFYFSRRGPPAL